MIYREATRDDITGIMTVRMAVKENRLSDPSLVTPADCEEYIFNRGNGWICEHNDHVVGFAIVSVRDNNVWALFVHPDHEGKGIGKKLHDMMIHWYFSRTDKTLWLSTGVGTRAVQFYRKNAWKETGAYGKNEIRFERSSADSTGE